MVYGEVVKINEKFYMSVTPNLTSNTEPFPYVVTSSNLGQNAYRCFNTYDNTYSIKHGQWVAIFMGEKTTINAFFAAHTSGNGFTVLYGSDDGINYTVIGQTSARVKTLVFDQPVSYRYYHFAENGWDSNYGGGGIVLYALCQNYFLINENNLLKTVLSGNLLDVEVVSEEVTEEIFKTKGFQNIEDLNSVVNSLGESFEILNWSGDNFKLGINVKFVPKPQLLLPVGDLKLSDFLNIKNISLTVTGTYGDIRVIVSFDGGENWNTFSFTESWQSILPTVEAAGENGIYARELSQIPKEKWDEKIVDKLRFAYYFKKSAIEDDVAVDNLIITGDMKGAWRRATHTTDYNYEYTASDTLVVSLLANGSYKINY